MTSVNIIAKRKEAVEAEMLKLSAMLSALQLELDELLTAERVMARLTGAEPPRPRPKKYPVLNIYTTAADGVRRTLPQMILLVLGEYDTWLTPKEIETAIQEKFKPAKMAQNVNSVVWRLASRGRVERDGDKPLYRIAQTNKATDANPQEEPSSVASASTQNRQAGSGGGP